jgi:hypothetical protein
VVLWFGSVGDHDHHVENEADASRTSRGFPIDVTNLSARSLTRSPANSLVQRAA